MIELRVTDSAGLVVPGDGGEVTVADTSGSVVVATEVGLPGPAGEQGDQGEPGADGDSGGSALPDGGSPLQILTRSAENEPEWATGQVRLKSATINFGAVEQSIAPITLSFGVDVTFYFFVAIVVTNATGDFIGLSLPFTKMALNGLILVGTGLSGDTVTGINQAKSVGITQNTINTYTSTGAESGTPVVANSLSASSSGKNGDTLTGLFPVSFGRATLTLPDDAVSGEIDLSFCYVVQPLNPSVPSVSTYLANTVATASFAIAGLTI